MVAKFRNSIVFVCYLLDMIWKSKYFRSFVMKILQLADYILMTSHLWVIGINCWISICHANCLRFMWFLIWRFLFSVCELVEMDFVHMKWPFLKIQNQISLASFGLKGSFIKSVRKSRSLTPSPEWLLTELRNQSR